MSLEMQAMHFRRMVDIFWKGVSKLGKKLFDNKADMVN